MTTTTISHISVDRLHDQFDVALDFTPGLNVVYGKNGRGKTTILHILANVLEADFSRFRFLQFREIRIRTHGGGSFRLERTVNPTYELRVFLDGQTLAVLNDENELPTEVRATIRDALGDRPVYLPAFRAILERVRSDAYIDPSSRDTAFERIRLSERQILVDEGMSRPRAAYPSGRFDQSALTARKTIQCREWFGPFVPVVRYPSIMEVTDRLSTEFREAQLETGSQERRMLSEMFVEVFRALLSEEDVPSESEVDTLMARVRTALEADETGTPYGGTYSDQLGVRLSEAAGLQRGSNQGGAAERRVLKLYAQMLERRNQERQSAFAKVRLFEAAVNKFLDDKTLHVTDDRNDRTRSRGVYVETENGRSYSLGSLSSGERQVLTMLFSATRMSTATGIFLIDEPELSLHIDWQRIILSELMSQAGGRQIIACTHSPEVGADHLDAVQIFSPDTVFDPLPSQTRDESESLDDPL
ncbi:AAA family ATPase [Burkholderia ubonensis]|uniref:AAA family ATPase n=1 Tax=Burkholderia ubonensis TaxID=101571 RepID=UPI0008FDF734|nr:AAA family ATPase [Burkholderia ubonensis]